jgi:hypothetical protein
VSREVLRICAIGVLLCLLGCDKEGPNPLLFQKSRVQLDVVEEATFLAPDENRVDVRTNHFIRVQVSRRDGSPVSDLPAEAFSFEQDGEPATVENTVEAAGDLAKVDISLCLDNSTTVSPFVDELRVSAKGFVATIEPNVDSLSIYVFSTTSFTYKVAEFRAMLVADAIVWVRVYLNDDPLYDLDPADYDDPFEAIDSATQVQLDGTALYQVVDTAIALDEGKDDIIVLFSDGKEQGSADGSVESALEQIDLFGTVVYGVGIGEAVRADLDALAVNGGVFIAESISDIAELFDRVANLVRSIYSLVYSAPDQFGDFDLTLFVEVPRENSARTDTAKYETSFLAGVDLGDAAYSTPVIPLSRLRVRSRTSPDNTAWSEDTWTVESLPIPIPDTLVSSEGVLHFEVFHQTSASTSDHAVYGEGERNLLGPTIVLTPEQAIRNATWRPFPDEDPNPRLPGGAGALVSVITDTRERVVVPSTRERFYNCIEVTTYDTSVSPSEVFERSYWAEGIGLVFAERLDDRGRYYDSFELLEHDVPDSGFRN